MEGERERNTDSEAVRQTAHRQTDSEAVRNIEVETEIDR